MPVPRILSLASDLVRPTIPSLISINKQKSKKFPHESLDIDVVWLDEEKFFVCFKSFLLVAALTLL